MQKASLILLQHTSQSKKAVSHTIILVLLYRSIRTACRMETQRETLAHARAECSFIKTCQGNTIHTPHEKERGGGEGVQDRQTGGVRKNVIEKGKNHPTISLTSSCFQHHSLTTATMSRMSLRFYTCSLDNPPSFSPSLSLTHTHTRDVGRRRGE